MRSRHAQWILTCLLMSICTAAAAQQTLRAQRTVQAPDDSLVAVRQRLSPPVQRMRIANLGALTVRTGDQATERVRDIVVSSFAEQQTFAERLDQPQLVSAAAIADLPEVDDEVLIFDDSIVIRRKTTIVVIDPQAVARESELFRDYLGDRGARRPARAGGAALAVAQPTDLDAEERAGLQEFMRDGVNALHPKDPLRAAAARGEEAVLEAIAAGQGALTIEDTLIIPKESGIDQGAGVAIPAVRNGLLDLRNPQPVTALPIRSLGVTPPEPPPAPLRIQATPVQPEEPPPRQPLQPKHEASGKKTINAEFLLGVTRAANFQWERTWSYTSGFFRLTLGSGYAIGYRVPVIATATVEPTRGYIRDYTDKPVVIGAAASARTLDANANFYRNAGLDGDLVQGGRELLLEANVGFGYKFRALWKTISERPYASFGVSYSQNFRPPQNMTALQGMGMADAFGMTLDPKTTKARVQTTFVDGDATLKFDGRAWGGLAMDLQTLVDGKTQKSFELGGPQAMGGPEYPYRIRIDPKPLRQGTTRQTRDFGVRLTGLKYRARIIVTPMIKFGFRVGYKRLSAHFSTPWIPLNKLQVDTGDFTMGRHEGTRADYTWSEGEKTYQHIEKPPSGPRFDVGR